MAEAIRFLRGMRFSSNRGAYAEGEHVSVVVDPEWNEADDETLAVLITCHARGPATVDWSKLKVAIRWEAGDAEIHDVLPFDADGRVLFPSVEPGKYVLATYQRAEGGLVPPAQAYARAAAARPGAARVARVRGRAFRPTPAADLPPHARREFVAPDASVSAVLEPTTEGIRLLVRTERPDLRGAQVTFVLIEAKTGAIVQQGQVCLERKASAPYQWEGEWKGAFSAVGPCELAFDVLPMDEP